MIDADRRPRQQSSLLHADAAVYLVELTARSKHQLGSPQRHSA